MSLALLVLATTASAAWVIRRKAGRGWRAWLVIAALLPGLLAIRAVLDPAVVAIEAVDPARSGYLGGLGLPRSLVVGLWRALGGRRRVARGQGRARADLWARSVEHDPAAPAGHRPTYATFPDGADPADGHAVLSTRADPGKDSGATLTARNDRSRPMRLMPSLWPAGRPGCRLLSRPCPAPHTHPPGSRAASSPRAAGPAWTGRRRG